MKKQLGIYIHIPFCLKKCGYCDFCSFVGKSSEYMSRYADELCRRIAAAGQAADGYAVDTVYFGGGTPSLMAADDIGRVLSAVRESFDVIDSAEITLECNPATADRQYFEEIRAFGVNRLSMGMQSALDTELRLLGRAHNREEFLRCFADARAAGFYNVSVDLMYGIPNQTMESLRESVELLTSLSPEHISAYGLMIEDGTPFARRIDELSVADDDGQAQMYLYLCEALRAAGYERYEISNFARVGRESRHNTRYWLGSEYIGFGVAAHSYFGGERYGNSRDIDAFMESRDICCERETVCGEDIRMEYVMLRMRLCEGVSVSDYKERFGRDFLADFPQIQVWIKQGFVALRDGRVAFTDKGSLVSNVLLSEMLS